MRSRKKRLSNRRSGNKVARRGGWLVVLGLLWWLPAIDAAAPVEYRLSFPEPEHHWMQVEMVVSGVGPGPLELRMSRTSPGRYSLHEFAKNVYDVRAFDAADREVPAVQPDPFGWRVEHHGGTVTVRYKVFGDRVDGTYLAVDPTHAHINMPAALMFARGIDDRPATIHFTPPPGRDNWRIATQLIPGENPLQFTAPNLQYLMDSPVEFGPVAVQSFVLDGRTFRVAVHHNGSADDLTQFVRDVRAIVAEQRTVFGEYPNYDPGYYTFLADYLPYASGDGMEHRNSTVLTANGSLRADGPRLLGTVAHEFFHNWNVERIRPRSLEPFNFEAPNMSSELWLAEGFTQYYGPLTLSRAGLADVAATAASFEGLIEAVARNPARLVRGADAMSRMAVFTDGARPVDATNWSTTYISYYPYGAAIALALDLTLRDRFDGKLSLDDYMRALWRTFGRAGGSRTGYVDHPYTMSDAERVLADIAGSPEFAREFFARYVVGHEAADYERLFERAGFLLRRRQPDAPWAGPVELARGRHGLRVESATVPGTPLYEAGIDRGDELVDIDGRRMSSEQDFATAVSSRKPNDRLRAVVADRAGTLRTITLALTSDPSVQLVPVERAGGRLTDSQRAFRRRWLESQR